MLITRELPINTLIHIKGIPFETKSIVLIESDEKNFELIEQEILETSFPLIEE